MSSAASFLVVAGTKTVTTCGLVWLVQKKNGFQPRVIFSPKHDDSTILNKLIIVLLFNTTTGQISSTSKRLSCQKREGDVTH